MNVLKRVYIGTLIIWILLIVCIVVNHFFSFIPIIKVEDDIFNNSLAFYYSIIGFLIALIIFTVQYINQKIDAAEIEKLPFTNFYSLLTIVLLFLVIIYNNLTIALGLKEPFSTVSLVTLLASILLIVLNLFITISLLSLNNLLTQYICQTLRSLRVSRSSLEDIQAQFKEPLTLFLNIAKKSMRNDQKKIALQSLESINILLKNYLTLTPNFSVEDSFVNELNDRISFLIDDAIELRDEKYLEDIADFLYQILMDIISYRLPMAHRHPYIYKWISTMENLFYTSYPKERTIVCHKCLEHIDNVSSVLLDRGLQSASDEVYYTMGNIADSLLKSKRYWSALLLQNVLNKYQKHLKLVFLYYRKDGNIFESLIDMPLEKASDIINKSKVEFSDFGSKNVIFATYYGINSQLYDYYSSDIFMIENDDDVHKVFYIIRKLIAFHYKTISTNPTFNDHRVFMVFLEFQYIIYTIFTDRKDVREELIKTVYSHFEGLLKCFFENRTNKHGHLSEFQFKEYVIHFCSMMIYFNEEESLIHKYIKLLIDTYILLSKEGRENRFLYQAVKLVACWLELHKLESDFSSETIDFLVADYREKDSQFLNYSQIRDYPDLGPFWDRKLWYLPPNYLWGNDFQSEIDQRLNGDCEKYDEFHNLIETLSIERCNRKGSNSDVQ